VVDLLVVLESYQNLGLGILVLRAWAVGILP
jgi:hypothetical protein